MRNACCRSLLLASLILASFHARLFAADLALTKQASKADGINFTNQFLLGDALIFTITFTNHDAAIASNLVGSDILPAGVRYDSYFALAQSGGVSPVYNPTNGVWTMGYLANTNYTRLFLFATATNVGTFTNTATITGSTPADPNTNNNFGTAIITVSAIPPAITNHPQDQTVILGSNVTFSVTATGTPPLSFQWRFKGTNLLNGTNMTLTLTNVQLSQEGEYDVIVTNAGGMDGSGVAFLTVVQFDWGDAPAVYPTKLADNGARHKRKRMPDGYVLGLGFDWDGEANGQPDATATGDDNAGQADEDGVTFSTLPMQGQKATISVWASHDARLDAWVDFNANNSWADAGEKVLNNDPLKEGPNTRTFDVPANANVGNTFARFRFSTAGGLAATGEAADGEVEDYSLFIRRTNVANVRTNGPFVFKNTSAFDATTLQVVFVGTGGQLVNPNITMEPEDANGTPTVVVGNTVSVSWVNKIRKGSLIAFSVQCPGPIQVNSATWSDGVNNFAGTLHANLDSAQPIPPAPVDLRFRVRKSYKDYAAADLDRLVEAMLMLHDPAKAPPRDTKRPLQPGDPHDRYEEYVQVHDINQGTAHGGSHFTPWHRKLLLDFENDLRALDPKFKDLTVPFWDWTLADNNPFTDFLGGNGDPTDRDRVQGGPFGKTMNQWRTYAFQNSLKNWQRGYLKRQYGNANFNDSTLKRLGAGARTAALNEGDYAKFRAIWENGVEDPLRPAPRRAQFGTHNDAHVWVGGDLGIPTRGVNEPGFWLLHCFIDETWAEWQCKYGYNTFKKFAGQGADDPMKGFPGTPPPAANTMFNYLTLGFTYEYAGMRVDTDPKCKVPKLPRLIINLINQLGQRLHQLLAQTRIGFTYQVQSSTNLLAWNLGQPFVATNDMTELVTAESASDPQRFYFISQLVGGASGTNFVVEAFADENQGQISPEGVLTANAGEPVNFLATPLSGFAVDQWYVDGEPAQTGGSAFTLSSVQGDHTVSVGFYDATAPSADLVVSLAPSPNPANMGEPVAYSVVVSNAGPQTATSILLIFEPEHMSELVEVTASQGATEIMGDPPLNVHHVRLAVDELTVGSAATLTVTLMHHEAGTVMSAAWAIAAERDPLLDDSEAFGSVTIQP